MITTREDSVLFEVTTTLREWHKIWLTLYLDNKTELFHQIATVIEELIDARVVLLKNLDLNNNHYCEINQDATSDEQQPIELNEQQLKELKNAIVKKLDFGNCLLGLDLVPRDSDLKLVDPVELSPIRLYSYHNEAATRVASMFGTTSNEPSAYENQYSNLNSANQTAHHLQLSFKNHYLASLPPDECVEIYLSLVDSTVINQTSCIKPFTEKFLVQISNDEVVTGATNSIFTNIGSLTGRDIYLYVQVYRLGKMTLADGNKTAFGRQTSSQNVTSNTSHDGSTNSINSANKYTPNGLARSYHTSIGSKNIHNYRRPFGTNMILLHDASKSPNFKEVHIGIKVICSNESGFSQLNDLYAKRNHSLKVNQNLLNVQFDLSYRFMSCPEESVSSHISVSPFCITQKKGLPDIVMPGDFKNDLYFTLESGEFEKGGKSISKNIEASISLVDIDGKVIDNCISISSNCDNTSNYNSCVYYHCNSPKWNESIKINVPLSRFDGAHIRIEFRHCSTKDRDKKFLGFSFLPLSDQDGTVIPDKMHDLYLYKYDSQLLEDDASNLSKYTSLPFGPSADTQTKIRSISLPNFTHSSREIVTVNTYFLSTKLTQNSNLLNLLRWRELIKRNNKDFEEALKKVLEIRGEEIVKFLQDILDTLFDTFTLYSTSEDDKCALIFKVLVHIFLLIDEPKYQHFRPVMDTYASAHFSATLVYKGLLVCFKKCLDFSLDIERHEPIQKCFKSMKYVFQFIVQSKLLYSKATGESNDIPFLKDLRYLFKQCESMLSNDSKSLIPIQVTFLEFFPRALEQLVKVMSAQELVEVVTSLAGSVGWTLPAPLLKAKLIFMRETAKSKLIKNQDVRMKITENFCRHLESSIKHSEELELCHEVLETLITRIHDYHWPSIYRYYQLTVKSSQIQLINYLNDHNCLTSIMTVSELEIFSKTALNHTECLVKTITSVSKEVEPFVILLESLLHLVELLVKDTNVDRILVQKYCTCILTIMKLMSKSNFELFNQKRKIDLSKLSNLFKSFRAIFNHDWSVMQLTSHSILKNPINEICKDLRTRPEMCLSVHRQLESYIRLVVDYITHPSLQLESFSNRKKNYILNVFGDLRMDFAAHLIEFWKGLETISNINKIVTTFIPAFLDAALLPCDDLQKVLIPVFYDFLDTCSELNLRQAESTLMVSLDKLCNLNKGDQKFIDNFSSILLNNIHQKNPVWEQQGLKLVDSFLNLMHLLLDYRQSVKNNDSQSKRMSCLVDLLEFYKTEHQSDLHLKYLFKLCDLHLEVGNHVEAALCLKLYSDELKWHDTNLTPIEGYRPLELEWKRKEFLYDRIIQNFDIGKCWEESIGLCKELAEFYEKYLVDYKKLSSILKRRAHFLDNILSEHRPEREYFRVEFIGDLPNFVKGKEFIYRGGEYERLAAFMQRITAEFPGAQVLNFKSKQTISKDTRTPYLVISNVKPVPFIRDHLKAGQKNIDDKIIHYYLNNRLDTFSYDVPVMRTPTTVIKTDNSPEMNARNLWIGRSMLKLKKQLPDILPWSVVVSQDYKEISPINRAIETVSSMNIELIKLIQSFKNEPGKQISPLTMRLQGVIEAAVNGGPAVFVNAFLKLQPGETTHEYDQKSTLELRDLIEQQFSILEAGLSLHSKLAPPEVMPLHARLDERLQSIKKSLQELKRSSFDGKHHQMMLKFISSPKT